MERNFTGKTIDDAIKAASEELGLAREDFSVDVIENPKSGFLGLGAKPAVIKVTYKNEVNAVEFVEEFLDGLMEKMGIMEYELKVTEPEEKSIKAEINGSELASLIKKRSEVIDAVQSMTALAMNRHIEAYYKISVDINSGKEKNTARLENLAVKVAKQVQKTKRKVTLSSMNSAKRRVIHSKLQNFENITTYSVGEEPNRRVVIAYKWPEGQEPPAEPERRPYPPKGNGGKKPYRKNGGYGNKGGYRKPRREDRTPSEQREENAFDNNKNE